MEPYNFLADMLTTFRSSSDFIKALWLLSPALFVLALGTVLRWQPRQKTVRPKPKPLALRHHQFRNEWLPEEEETREREHQEK